MFEVATAVEFYQRRGQDRVDVIEHAQGRVLVVADGAGERAAAPRRRTR